MRRDYDVVHSHLIKSIVMCRLGFMGRRRSRRPKLVSQIPGVVHLQAGWLRRIDRVTLWLDDVTVGSCTDFAHAYQDMGARRTAVSFYGMDTGKFLAELPERSDIARANLGMREEDVVVIMVAHMYPTNVAHFADVGVKGHEVFIDAAAKAHASDARLKFLIVGDEFAGDGSYMRRLEARAKLASDSIKFLGHRDDVPTLLAAADVAANPSLSESASYTMMEASLAGLPVVASSVGGLLDTVVDGVTGLFVPAKDVDALASAFLTLADDERMRQEMGRAGRAHIQTTFDITRTVDSLESIYDEVRGRG